MTKDRTTKVQKPSFLPKLQSLLIVDFRRMFTMPLFYIMAGVSLVLPILILVMTSMMGGEASDGAATADMFTNVWQAIGSASSDGMGNMMSLTGMCNINMLYFLIGIMVCIFISDDFRSGYAKNLFAVHSKKADYVMSKMLVCFVCGMSMLLCYFVGAMLGGAIAWLSFDAGVFGAGGIVCCMLAKIFLAAVFVSICVLASTVAKQKLWLSILIALGVGMLLFTMIPLMTPLDAGALHVVLCFAGGVLFSVGFGALGCLVLNKTSLV